MKRVLVPALVAVLLATAGRSLAQNPAAMKTDMKGCGPSNELFNLRMHTKPSLPHPPSPGDSALYFIGYLSQVRVGLDGKWLGALSWSSYAEFEIAQGVHHLCIRRQGQHKLLDSVALYGLNATAGNSYYFLVASGSDDFEEINPDEARLMIATSKFGLITQNLSHSTGLPISKKRSGGGQK